MKFRLILLILVVSSVLFSCKFINSRFEGEPPASFDATPPLDYNPQFITKIEKFDKDVHVSPKAIISSVDVRQPNSVKLKMHFIDKNYVYLTGITKGKGQNYWCEVIDEYQGKETVITKYKLSEVTQDDQIKTALAIVMDHSGSMGDNRARVVQEAVDKVIRNKGSEDGIALIKYDNRVGVESGLSYDKDELLGKLQKNGLTGYGNLTAINNGIFTGIKELESAERGTEKAIVVFTDGYDNSSTLKGDSIIKMARANNSIICGIDFGENINKDFIKSYSDSTSGIYHHIYLTDEFNLVFQDIYNRLKNNYVLEYTPKEFGVHKVKVKMCFPFDTVTATTEFDNTPDIGAIGMIPINFDFNKTTYQKQSEEAIDNIYMLLKAYPNMVIELRGHTDSMNSTKDPDYNTKLSQKRADVVKQVLVKKGIASDRISTIGLGESQPIATNDTEEGRAKNRRTEFKIIKR